MTGPVDHNLCEDMSCEHRCVCLRWRSPVDPNHPISRFPDGCSADQDCPHLVDRRDFDARR